MGSVVLHQKLCQEVTHVSKSGVQRAGHARFKIACANFIRPSCAHTLWYSLITQLPPIFPPKHLPCSLNG